MTEISEALRELLARQDMRGVGLQSGRANEMADAVEGVQPHRPTAGEGFQPMGMGKTGDRSPRQVRLGSRSVNNRSERGHFGDPFLRLVADNVDKLPTRKGRALTRPFLVCRDGVRLVR